MGLVSGRAGAPHVHQDAIKANTCLIFCHAPLDDVLGASSTRLSPHLGPLPMGEEESSFTLFQSLPQSRKI